jgi:hypothetical protein
MSELGWSWGMGVGISGWLAAIVVGPSWSIYTDQLSGSHNFANTINCFHSSENTLNVCTNRILEIFIYLLYSLRVRTHQLSRVESNPVQSDSQKRGNDSVAYLQWPPRLCVHTSRVESSRVTQDLPSQESWCRMFHFRQSDSSVYCSSPLIFSSTERAHSSPRIFLKKA